MHTIEAFHFSDLKPEIILVLNQDYHSLWTELCLEHHFDIPCTIVSNGVERFHSVKNGLSVVDEASIVAVHDAVRPVITNELITKVFNMAERAGTAIPVVTSKDSVRKREGNATVSLNRQDVLLVQTPQAFQFCLLKAAYDQQFTQDFTDDASVVEKTGVAISVTEGDYKNIKITFPEDLELAELYLRKRE